MALGRPSGAPRKENKAGGGLRTGTRTSPAGPHRGAHGPWCRTAAVGALSGAGGRALRTGRWAACWNRPVPGSDFLPGTCQQQPRCYGPRCCEHPCALAATCAGGSHTPSDVAVVSRELLAPPPCSEPQAPPPDRCPWACGCFLAMPVALTPLPPHRCLKFRASQVCDTFSASGAGNTDPATPGQA